MLPPELREKVRNHLLGGSDEQIHKRTYLTLPDPHALKTFLMLHGEETDYFHMWRLVEGCLGGTILRADFQWGLSCLLFEDSVYSTRLEVYAKDLVDCNCAKAMKSVMTPNAAMVLLHEITHQQNAKMLEALFSAPTAVTLLGNHPHGTGNLLDHASDWFAAECIKYLLFVENTTLGRTWIHETIFRFFKTRPLKYCWKVSKMLKHRITGGLRLHVMGHSHTESEALGILLRMHVAHDHASYISLYEKFPWEVCPEEFKAVTEFRHRMDVPWVHILGFAITKMEYWKQRWSAYKYTTQEGTDYFAITHAEEMPRFCAYMAASVNAPLCSALFCTHYGCTSYEWMDFYHLHLRDYEALYRDRYEAATATRALDPDKLLCKHMMHKNSLRGLPCNFCSGPNYL